MSSLYWCLPSTDIFPVLISSLNWCPPPILMSSLYWCPPYTDVFLKLMSSLFWCCPFTGVLLIIMSSLVKLWNFPNCLPSWTLTFHPSVGAKFCHSLNISVPHFAVTKILSPRFPQSLNHSAPCFLSLAVPKSPNHLVYYSLYLHSTLKSFGSPKNTVSYRLFIETATILTFKSIKTFK